MTGVILARMKTAISVPDDLFRRAEQLARRRGLCRSALFAAALRRYLDDAEAQEVTSRLDAVYAATPATVDPALMALQIASLERDDW